MKIVAFIEEKAFSYSQGYNKKSRAIRIVLKIAACRECSPLQEKKEKKLSEQNCGREIRARARTRYGRAIYMDYLKNIAAIIFS